MILVLGVNLINAISIGNGTKPDITGDEWAEVWSCGHQIINNGINVDRINNTAFYGEKIQWSILVMNRNGANKIQKVLGTIYSTQNSTNTFKFSCIEDSTTTIILDSCNAHILEQKITDYNAQVMKYYLCTLNINDSKNMDGLYQSIFEAQDLSGISNTNSGQEYWILNPKIIYPNPEAIIKYDSISKNLTIIGNSENVSVSKIEKCLNRGCTRKIENYTLTNEYGKKLYLLFQHDNYNTQESIKLLSIKYNSNKEIKINRLYITDSKNKLYLQFVNKTSSISLDTNKKTNKTKVQIKNKKINNSVNYNNWNIEFKTSNGSLNYNFSSELKKNITLTDNDSHVLPNGQIDCDWRPYTDSNGCYAIFGSPFVQLLKDHPKVCIKGEDILGYYYNGKSCNMVSGFGVEGNFTLFKDQMECFHACSKPSVDV
jgi:hypothetical protein